MSLEWFIDYTFQFIVAGALSSIVTWLVAMRKTSKELEAEHDRRTALVEAGLKALLRDRIISACHKAKQQGFAYMHETENVDKMFRAYTDLGENGAIKHLVKEFFLLPVRTDLK